MADQATHLGPGLLVEGASSSAVVQRTLAEARRHLELDIAYVAELRDGARIFRYVDGDELPDGVRVGTSDPIEDSVAGHIQDGDLPPLMRDASGEAERLPEIRTARVGAFASAPIRLDDGEVFGMLICYAHDPKPDLDDSGEGYLHLMARVISEHVERDAGGGTGDLRRQLDRVERLLEPGGIRIELQPICDLTTGAVVGAEALARFDIEPTLSPSLIFEDAWTVGRGVELELAAVRAAVGHLAELPSGVFLGVNVSPQTMLTPELIDAVSGGGERVVLEIPERAAIERPYDLEVAVRALRQAGVRLAADDAGAGFGSLSHILELRPELIKFDVSLTREVDTDAVRRGLAGSLVAFATQFDALVVAEGIETESELQTLVELGFGYGQGFLLGAPGPLPLPDRRR